MSSTHLGTTRNPMSEARRQHLFGPIQSLIDKRPATEPHPLLGGALLIGLFVVGVLLIVGFSKYSGV